MKQGDCCLEYLTISVLVTGISPFIYLTILEKIKNYVIIVVRPTNYNIDGTTSPQILVLWCPLYYEYGECVLGLEEG